ncbi:putative helicase mov-10-B.1 [Engraulis encrasicolus]|uniref:putative helicase mov-10-B.1 n=1 Tax=Engraulis encrasicolus TaxID=184585 RepID=UPI002FD61655
MPRKTLAQNRQTGLDFIEFLVENNRLSRKYSKSELKAIYDNEFRDREVNKDERFSSIFYALCQANKVRVIRGVVHIKAQVRLLDQWQQPPRNGPASSAPSSNGAAAPGAPPDGQSGVKARRKLAASLLRQMTNDNSEFLGERGGVRITCDQVVCEGGRICVRVQGGEVCAVQLRVENAGEGTVVFTYYSLLHWIPHFYLEDEHRVTRASPLHLQPGDQYEVTLKFQSRQVGLYRASVVFEFRNSASGSGALGQPFHLVRLVEGLHSSPLLDALAPTAPFRPRTVQLIQSTCSRVEDGLRPDSQVVQSLEWVVELKGYDIPDYINDLINFMKHQPCESVHKALELKALLESPLSFENYCKRFQLLIQLEETQMQVDIRAYDMEAAKMTKDATNKRLLTLKVPGVAENRPSVLRGDHLLVSKSKEHHLGDAATKYKGYVHRVECEQVKLGFGQKLMSGFIDGMLFDVVFTVNRLPVRLQMRAVELAHTHDLKDLLFPSGSKVTSPAELPKPRLFDSKLEKNPEQYCAVQNMVAGVSRTAPYLLFGPPGTGKTVTIVEAIKQLYHSESCTHILACAPSNSATDLLCERVLEHTDSHRVYRIYASSRDPRQIPDAIRACCNFDGEDIVYPCKEELMEFKIIFTTVVTAGRLVSGGLPEGHFSHIFIDEAGHAPEPEALIPVAGLLDPQCGQLVLAGDPRQLGPIIRSPIAKQHGLEVSLLERLMKDNPLYQKDVSGRYNPRYVTKLLLNYRSHESILKVPNDLFYEGELIASADEVAKSMYCNWPHLPKKGFPVIFHGVVGKDEREENSPSFFNRSEVEVVLGYLRKLLLETQGKKGVARISPKDIGIIAPYRKQVEKLRQAIGKHDAELKKMMNIKNLKVASVEEFQGQERRVIIVSAVRSSGEHITLDEKFNIGFLKNGKRFNVAMTRAKALLIVVGNPVILRTDPTWGRFLEYCTSESGYTGFDFSTTEGAEEVVARLQALTLTPEDIVATGESAVQQLLDPEWRNEQ